MTHRKIYRGAFRHITGPAKSHTPMNIYKLKLQPNSWISIFENMTWNEIFVLAGEPLNEPVVKQGPFVMTNKTKLLLAYGEYKNGKFGREETIM